MKRPFHIVVMVTVAALAFAADAMAAQNRPTQFWNLTRNTTTEFYLAPAGTTNWSPNQCKNDRDGSVDADERLHITDVPSGTDVTGRTCTVHDIKIEPGSIFHIEERDLKSCNR
jgi:hypothetical protein